MTDKDPLEYDHAKNTILSLEKPLTFTQLREQSKINPTTLNRRIKSLMENNYIDKIIDKEDKETLKDVLLKIPLFGLPLNFAMFIVSKGFFKLKILQTHQILLKESYGTLQNI